MAKKKTSNSIVKVTWEDIIKASVSGNPKPKPKSKKTKK